MSERQLTVVAPRGYPWTFNGPRRSQHRIRVRGFAPLNKLRSSLDGVTAFSPAATAGAHLIHAFNRVPLNLKPFVIGFESHLPRVWGLEGSAYERFLFATLLGRRCRRIVAISHYAARSFHAGVAEARLGDEAKLALNSKLEVRYPNLDVPDVPPPQRAVQGEMRATFVGTHFGRKGGCVVARMAEIAYRRRLPIRFTIVSRLQAGGPIWTDPSRPGFFDAYLALLALPNVTHLPSLPNAEVKALLARSDVGLLPTFADTFGFSVLEAMAAGTPVLATAQAALPEVIDDGIDGMLLAPALTPGRDGWIWPYAERDTIQFERLFADEVERLAVEGIARLEGLLADPVAYAAMRGAAHAKALSQFSSTEARVYWDALYRDCADRQRTARRRGAMDLGGSGLEQGISGG
jgi:glycosyltransferase involved in cell wall biosynthesis